MTSDFLSDLDAAVEQRCACLCGMPISGTSPSAYFASELCSDRWHSAPGRIVPRPIHVSPLMHAEMVARSRANMRMFEETAAEVARTFRAAAEFLIEQFGSSIQELLSRWFPDMERPEGPADPQEHALMLRRRRNTGPQRRVPVPRQVVPAGGLRTAPCGRPPYQPPRC